jgi:hypothetical protein
MTEASSVLVDRASLRRAACDSRQAIRRAGARTGLFFPRQWLRDRTHPVDEKLRSSAEGPVL